MRMRHAIAAALAAACFSTVTGAVQAGPTGYVLGNGGTTLHTFDVASPGGAAAIQLTFGGVGASLDDIDFRPLTGRLYGYNDVRDAYFTVDVATGILTAASGPGVAATNSDKLGIDFNPVIDRLRTVSELGENIVYNPLTGGTTVATGLFYGAGDANAGATPQVVANAYTNSAAGAATTTQYVLDAGLDTLAILANNLGTLTTVGRVTYNGAFLDFGPDAGFDVFSGPGGVNIAYALLNVGNTSSLYTIDLSTATASLVGDLPGGFGTIQGLAIAPAAVPEPSAIVLAALAAGLVAPRLLRAGRARRASSAEVPTARA
ncbi:DUF4394 domain-containing protein [Paludisphaera mucosa]|uniref:DUF4394 domain-containing protein n=1 Tax=Paludisphaera mucosa TaxID=3030827 RepID=A0ABT6FHJ6_9BACT|nr:DUF4394 domain-containing protein [Paludisphaera mucosa]MDG3007066.1 DUF4394 domain-containing protein [Paludisphaera mucosa]